MIGLSGWLGSVIRMPCVTAWTARSRSRNASSACRLAVTSWAREINPVKVPSNVLPNLGPSGVKVAEAKYGVQPGKESIDTGEPDQPAKDDGTRKPLGDGKRAPLKRK